MAIVVKMLLLNINQKTVRCVPTVFYISSRNEIPDILSVNRGEVASPTKGVIAIIIVIIKG
jgi:hypothetical protein